VAAATRLLVVGDEYYAVLAGMRALRAGGCEPFLATPRLGTYAARSRATAGVVEVPDPLHEAEAFIAELANAAVRIGAAAVLPGTEDSLVALSQHAAAFPAGILLGVPSREAVARATDKLALPELARAAGLAIPETHLLNIRNLDTADVALPAVVKPRRTAVDLDVGMQRRIFALRVNDRAALRAALERLPDAIWVVQPFLSGELVAVAAVAWQGELVAAQHQRAIRTWPPDLGGSSFAITVAPDDELERAVSQIARDLQWSGLLHVQLIRTNDGDFLIDVNPRMWGSLGLAVAAGQNLPAIWADLLLGGTPSFGPYRVGATFRAELKDVRAVIFEARRKRSPRALRSLLPRPGTTHSIASLTDPGPFLGVVWQLVAQLRGRT
jgi:predicted ATP-grasp superfamily ATP-dependent carboligase